jgi:hypothetical protein
MKEITQLEIGKRYTIVRNDDMGFVFKLHVEIIEIKNEPYAQYPESILLIFKVKGKRNLRQLRFLPRDPYLVWNGWLEINTDMYAETAEECGFIVRKSLLSFDREYFERAKRSTTEQPIIDYKAY